MTCLGVRLQLSLWTTLTTLYLSLFLVYSGLSEAANEALSVLLILGAPTILPVR